MRQVTGLTRIAKHRWDADELLGARGWQAYSRDRDCRSPATS
ncbi:hypothetical protein I547_1945 [Mycobacterium kansasii 824]|uniref:Uncharacterized protein n=1 Tax=Mycobacterium kansasii TaxID=1768 RepID=A0A1V3WRY5_MYCKA|nr:hypothetical protein I547_1945 [Mycobacterium kansasii 824]OOK69060.1 hypothetical protein BZL30_7197 [Mycobacterium kansasii]OOK69684.1 hypothetical protein BZL29_6316 [Mycobacterium kansasii]